MDEFRQPGRGSEGFGIGSRCGVSRKGAVSKDLFGEVEDTRIAESGSRKRIPGDADEVQTGTEIEFTKEICGQINQEIYRAALAKHENSGFRKIPTEENIIEWSVESCGPDEHHAMEKDYLLLSESEELSDEQSDNEYLFEHVSDTDFLDVEELNVNDARSETSFAANLSSVASDNITVMASKFGGGVEASRNDILEPGR